MKILKIILVSFALYFYVNNVSAETVFAEGFEDLPIMPGLHHSDNQSIHFDTPGGRIVEVGLEGEDSKGSEVFKFYSETLPQLGWKLKENNKKRFTFTREDEELIFTVEGEAPVLVRIELTSSNNN
ncbi:MAG: hypothetical protein MJ247_05685 [Alphaproteobacteria bacterium]|nr:hypothetical protein [Alphaproteobacteria bacterium]